MAFKTDVGRGHRTRRDLKARRLTSIIRETVICTAAFLFNHACQSKLIKRSIQAINLLVSERYLQKVRLLKKLLS